MQSEIHERLLFIFQSSQWRNLQIDLFIAANAHWGNQQTGQKIPRLQQVWNHSFPSIIPAVNQSVHDPWKTLRIKILFSPFLFMARDLRKVHHYMLSAIIEKYQFKLKNSRTGYCSQYVRWFLQKTFTVNTVQFCNKGRFFYYSIWTQIYAWEIYLESCLWHCCKPSLMNSKIVNELNCWAKYRTKCQTII